jgi:hypothetical protein
MYTRMASPSEVVAKCAARSKRPFWRYESDTHSFVRRWLARNKRCNHVTSRVFSIGFSFFCKSSYEICLFWLTLYEWKERCGRSSWSTSNFKNCLISVGLICLYFLYFSRFVRGSRRLICCTIVPAKVLVLVAVGTCHHIEVCWRMNSGVLRWSQVICLYAMVDIFKEE